MKLRRLQINRLPGIHVPFGIEPDGSKFQVIFGPNGIGKSSICRAVEALYWSDRGPTQRTSVNAEFELEGDNWWVEREGARVRWRHDGADSAAPSLPSSHTANCFFLRLRDLIDPAAEGTRDVASEIRRQMSGGFDLRKITVSEFENLGSRPGRRERRAFDEAEQAVQKAEGKQAQLQRRADELDDLRARLAEVESNQRQLTHVERALGLLERRKKLADYVAEIEPMPEGLANLMGKEEEQLENKQRELDKLNVLITTREGEITAANKAKLDAGLNEPLGPADLTAWREYADELGRVELARQAARTKYGSCRAKLEAALSAIGNGNVDECELNLADHSALFEFLRTAEEHRRKVDAIEERLRLLGSVERPEKTPRDLKNIRAAAEALRSWLRSPDPELITKEARIRRIWMIAAAILFVSGAVLGILVDPTFVLVAAVGVGIGLPAFLRGRQAGLNSRQAAQDDFGTYGLEEPSSWETAAVESRLRDLDSEAAFLDAQLMRTRDRDVERQSLESKREGLSENETKIAALREKLQENLRLDEIRPDTDLVDFTRAIDQLRSARNEEQAAAGEVQELEARYSKLLSDLAEILESRGESRPVDAATAKAYLNQLAGRDAQLRKAISDHQVATNQLVQASDSRDAIQQSIAEIYSKAHLEVGDLHGITMLLGSLNRFLELKRGIERLESQNELDCSELAKVGDAKLAELDEVALNQLHESLAQSAEEAENLRNEIAEINAEVKAARTGHGIEDLIATRGDALINLHDCRAEVLYAQAGRFLMDSVEQEYEQTQMPRVFERARDLFSAFTHHNYELRLASADKAAQLIAMDLTSGELRELQELSDGARAQLLLAARTAFAEEVEQATTLPLFLDEALDQSDPVRYEAIVRSLGRVAADQNRQIFYLTSDPADVGRIQHALVAENCDAPSVIDLGLVRRNAASVSGPSALHVDPRPAVPRPDGLSAEEYGATLGVPPLNPSLGYERQHFFHVLWDDLELLHEFLTHGIERVGQWRTVLGTPLADKLGSDSKSSEEITHRVNLLEIFCEFWRQGRGQPIDRDVLAASGAVTDRYFDGVVEMAEELGGDAEVLLDAIRSRKDERSSGFRSNALERLDQYFRENGYIDDDPVLAEEELRLQALASPAANQLPEAIADECLNRWWTLAGRASR